MRILTYFFVLLLALPVLPVWAMPKIQEFETPSGVTAWLVSDHNIPFVALELRFVGGASTEPMDKRGVSNFMTALIEEGAGDLDAQAFGKAKEDLAASFRYDVGQDSLSVSARMLTDNRDQAVDLLKLSLTQPRFDPDAIERVRGQILSVLASSQQDPGDIASRAFFARAFPDHPYGSETQGTSDIVAQLTRDDLLAAHRRILVRDRLIVSAVGDISQRKLGELIDHLVRDLPATSTAALPEPTDDALVGGVSVTQFPTPQSVILFGHRGINQTDPDFFAAYVLNHILGGSGFESRLMTEVREKRGLTYGISTFLYGRDYGDLVMGQVASANDKAAETIAVIRDEWQSIQQNGVSAAELQAAKTYLTGAYPLRFDGNAPIARILVGMQRMGLSPDYIETRNDRINALTLDDVNRVAAQLFSPQDLHFTVVGQPVGLGE